MANRRRSGPPISLFAFQDIITAVTGIIILLTLLLTLELLRRDRRELPIERTDLASKLGGSLNEARAELEGLKGQLSRGDQLARQAAGVSLPEIERELELLRNDIERLTGDLTELRGAERRQREEKTKRTMEYAGRENDRQRLSRLHKERQRLCEEINNLRQSNRRFYRPNPSASKEGWLIDLSGDGILAARVGGARAPIRFHQQTVTQRVSALGEWVQSLSPEKDYFILGIRPSGIESYRPVRTTLRARGFELGLDLFGENEAVLGEEGGAGS